MHRYALLLLGGWAVSTSLGNPIAPIRLTVTDETGRTAFADIPGRATADGITWGAAEPVVLRDSGGWLATIAARDDDPLLRVSGTSIRFNFDLVAGQTDTTFTLGGPNVSFPAIADAHAAASATVTLTDIGADGATLIGLLPGGAIGFEYNGGMPFGELIDRIDAPPGGMQVAAERLPESGFTPLNDAASSGRVYLFAELTALDAVHGEGEFTFVPEPGALALLSISMTCLRRMSRPAL